jgi:SAM-dependent methyltransferase
MTPGADNPDNNNPDAPLLDRIIPAVPPPSDAELEALADFSTRLDRLALLAMCRTLRRAGLFGTACTSHSLAEIQTKLRVAPRHHRLIRRWLTALERENMLVRDALAERYATLYAADAAALRRARGSLIAALPRSGYSEELARFFLMAFDYLPQLLSDDISLQSLLFDADTSEAAEGIYRDNSISRHINAVAAAAVAEAARRATTGQDPFHVLEVGAGVGGTSAGVLHALASYRVSYRFTDVSRFFLTSAERRFAGCPSLTFGTFDMNRDYADQGYDPASADAILCANVLHNARDADWVLGKLAELLAPGGWLVFIDTCRDIHQIMASMEFLMSPAADDPGFDFGDFRHGQDRIFITHDEWLALLIRTGFSNVTCLPGPDSPVARFGQHVFAAQKGR